MTNPFHWNDRREHAVEKPRRHNHMGGYTSPDEKKGGGGKKGGILNDDAGGSGATRGRGKVQKKVAKKGTSPAALTVADMMLPRNNFVRSSILKGMYDDSSSSSSEEEDRDVDDDQDPLKEERKILAKKKRKLLAKYDRMIARSEKVRSGEERKTRAGCEKRSNEALRIPRQLASFVFNTVLTS